MLNDDGCTNLEWIVNALNENHEENLENNPIDATIQENLENNSTNIIVDETSKYIISMNNIFLILVFLLNNYIFQYQRKCY